MIGPLTGRVSANGLGGRISAKLAVKLRDQDESAKYEHEMKVLDRRRVASRRQPSRKPVQQDYPIGRDELSATPATLCS